MLQTVDVGKQFVEGYETTVGRDVEEEVTALAQPLKGARVLHLNATPYGGGLAEILRSEVPLLRDLGLRGDWKIITGGKGLKDSLGELLPRRGHVRASRGQGESLWMCAAC